MNELDRLHANRLDILERRCARLRVWCAILSAGALTACLSSALRPKSEIIEARRFVVVGADGSVQASLGGDDEPPSRGLVLFGDDHEPVAFLSVFRGKGPASASAVLHLESEDENTKAFTASAGPQGATCSLGDDHLSIESRVKPGGSGIHFTTRDGRDEGSSTRQVREGEEDGWGTTLMRLDVLGDKPSIEGRTPSGDVVFRNP